MSATLHRKLSPALFDIPIEHIGRALVDNIPWLSEVYGKAEAITHTLADGTRPVWPDWPMEGNEYITLLPDDRDGGYAFFVLDEPVSLEHDGGKWHAPLSLVVWGDMREASPADLLQALRYHGSRERSRFAGSAQGSNPGRTVYRRDDLRAPCVRFPRFFAAGDR